MNRLSVISLLIFVILFSSCTKVIPEVTNELEEFIFIGHPRTNDKVNQSMLPAVENIDYSRFSMTLLGGDLTQNSASYEALSYLDSILDLGSSNTLFAIGNHDDPSPFLYDFTGRNKYYSYYRNGITYLILDTEDDPGIISNDQIDLIQNITDTVSISTHLVLMHHRIFWMIGNNDLDSLLPLVGGSTRDLLSTNFYTDIYPLLLNVEKKGTDVICLAGDRTDININYVTNDSIQFIATGMNHTRSDSDNYVIIFQHNIKDQILDWSFQSLNEL